MNAVLHCDHETFKRLTEVLKQTFQKAESIDAFDQKPIDLEQIFSKLIPAETELELRAKICIQHDLISAIRRVTDNSEIQAGTKWNSIFNWKSRVQSWAQLQAEIDWILPRLSISPLAQHVVGLLLLAAFCLQFYWPLLGTPLFFGGVIFIYQLEKWVHAIPYSTVAELATAMVPINQAALELGVVDSDLLRIVFAEILIEELNTEIDPQINFPQLLVSES